MVSFNELRTFPWGPVGLKRGASARDLRLAVFGQGGWADRVRGSGLLALQADDASKPEALREATADEVLGIGRAWRALETWAFARKLDLVRELIRRYPANERYEVDQACGLPEEWDPRLHHEVAAALGISTVAARKLVDLAWTLDSRLPGIGQALEENKLDPGRVKLIVAETSVLDREDLFAKVQEIILAGLGKARTWMDLLRLLQGAVITVDPEGAEKRRLKAEREDARIRFWRENTGACGLQGTGLPTDQALAAHANVEARALEYKAAGVREKIDILRVMAYLDLLNGVSVSQRLAWAQEEEARRADAEERAAEAGRPSGGGGDPDSRGPNGGGPDGGGPDGGDPDGGDPDGGGSNGGGPDANGPDSRGPDGGGPDGRRPDADGPGGGRDGDNPGDSSSDCPDTGGPERDDPGVSGGGIDGDGCGGRGGQGGRDDAGGAECAECGGAGGVAGLPLRVSLTVPMAALGFLAELAVQARGPTGRGRRAGPGLAGRSAGACPACGRWGGGSTGLPARGDLAFPLLTMLGLAVRPGEAHGLGALDAGLMRDLASVGARHPGSRFCLTVVDENGYAIGHGCCRPMRGRSRASVIVDPERATVTPSGRAGPTGGFGSWIVTLPGARRPFIVDIDPVPTYECDHRFESHAYGPSEKLRHLVQVRDGKCSFPACARHARDSDFEHAEPFRKGGRTCACNAHACSRSCHRCKQSKGWRVTKPRPGWTQWTTMAGRVYEQGPWRYPV